MKLVLNIPYDATVVCDGAPVPAEDGDASKEVSSSLTSLAPVASRQCDALAQRAYAAIATAERVWREAAESLHSKLVKYAAYHPSHHLTPHHTAARTPCYFFRSPLQAGGYAA